MPTNRQSLESHLDLPPTPRVAALQRLVWPLLRRVLRIDQLDEIYRYGAETSAGKGTDTFETDTLEGMRVTWEVNDDDLAAIPDTGPVLVIANHPFGMIEGVAMGHFVKGRRNDYKVLGTDALGMFPALRPNVIPVRLDSSSTAKVANLSALRNAMHWLDDGHCLGMFPAGEVSHRTWNQWRVTDSPWNRIVAKLARRRDVSVVPIFFHGYNPMLFHLAGLLWPQLRTALLPANVVNKRGLVLQATIGKPVDAPRIAECKRDSTLTEYLRSRVFMLEARRRPQLAASQRPLPRTGGHLPRLSSADRCAGEVLNLTDEHLLLDSGDLSVFIAPSLAIPNIVREIGRLREVAFRAVGEGSGNDLDLDQFDRSYRHLFIWNNKTLDIIGAYRLGLTDELMQSQGLRALYTRTLFRYDAAFLERLGPSIELGRSFIRPEYQRTFKPLLLLWKGICRFICEHPKYRHAYGAVSISNDYQPLSKRLMTEYLNQTCRTADFQDLVQARTPHAPEPVLDWNHERAKLASTSLDSVESMVREIEGGTVGLPILLKQYLKLNATLLADFNVDRDFADAIDGLMLVDFIKVERRIADYYMGPDAYEAFLMHHGIRPPSHGELGSQAI